jgi:hypothetical protein
MKKLLLAFSLVLFYSCEKDNVICDTSFRSLNLYVRDTLEYVIVRDINLGHVLYSDSGIYNQFKVVDDSYLHIMGANNQTTLNIDFRYVNDSVYKRISPICIFTDECHINFYYPSDTL